MQNIDRVLDTVRDRPGSTLIVSCAGAAVLGFLGGRILYKSHGTLEEEANGEMQDNRESLGRQYRETTNSIPDNYGRRATDDSSRMSGASTPQSSVTGTPRKTFANELSSELDLVLALVYRTDLGISKGRLVTLTTQVAIGHFKQLYRRQSPELKIWERGNKSKICLQCPSKEELLHLQDKAAEKGVKTFKVSEIFGDDHEREVAVLAIGPAKGSLVKELTGHLLLEP